MAAADILYQYFFPIYSNRMLSVTKVRLVATSNTFTLPLAIVSQSIAFRGPAFPLRDALALLARPLPATPSPAIIASSLLSPYDVASLAVELALLLPCWFHCRMPSEPFVRWASL